MSQHFKISGSQSPKSGHEEKYMKRVPYASSVGSLMYLMVCTRPDMAYSVCVVSRFMANPGEEHWLALKWILRYIKGTMNHGLMYRVGTVNGNPIKGYVDSDYAGSIDTRKSFSWYLFTGNDNPVSWKAALQQVVALSSTEAEYMAMTEAFKEAKWMKGLMTEFGFEQELLTVYCDNKVQYIYPNTKSFMKGQNT
ncbi:secreted RxLR effector protein 161-like [Primulina eburnea]|uniref:secreted RxLR effector protein 161-like n=1 Tax=Primulina eburnea TaxID=1245227 RepID=UPI003C6CB1E0